MVFFDDESMFAYLNFKPKTKILILLIQKCDWERKLEVFLNLENIITG